MSYNFTNGMPYQSPNWAADYIAGLQELSAPELQTRNLPAGPALSVPYSPMSAGGVIPAAAPPIGFMAGLGKIGGWIGKNGQTIGNIAGALSSGVQAYVGLQQLGLAKDALKFEKKAYKTNLANQVDSYNTQMKDRVTGRWYATEEERQAALREAELPQGMRG